MISPLISYVLKSALRDRFAVALLIMLALGSSLSLFMGSAAVSEKEIFALVFAAGGLRIAGAVCLSLFVVSFIRRSHESRDIEYLLTRPISRFKLIFSYSAAFWILAVILTAMEALCLFGMGMRSIAMPQILWLSSIAVEYIIIAQAALFFAMVLRSTTTAVMAVIGFYILSRMMGQILGIIDFGPTKIVLMDAVMQGISMCFPRLDLMGQSGWLIYGAEPQSISFVFVFAQGVIFTAFLMCAGLFDLRRRQF